MIDEFTMQNNCSTIRNFVAEKVRKTNGSLSVETVRTSALVLKNQIV